MVMEEEEVIFVIFLADLDIKLRLPLNDHDDDAIRAIVVDFGNIFDRKREKLYVSL